MPLKKPKDISPKAQSIRCGLISGGASGKSETTKKLEEARIALYQHKESIAKTLKKADINIRIFLMLAQQAGAVNRITIRAVTSRIERLQSGLRARILVKRHNAEIEERES